MRSVGGASSHTTAHAVALFVARKEQRGPLQRSARARSRGEKERSREHIACAVGSWRARCGVCESQRDVNFVSHWCSCGEQMESQVRCVIGVVFINSISRLSVFFPPSILGYFFFVAGKGGEVLCFVGSRGLDGWRRAFRARSVDALMSG